MVSETWRKNQQKKNQQNQLFEPVGKVLVTGREVAICRENIFCRINRLTKRFAD